MEYYKNLDLENINYFCEIDKIWKTEEWKDVPDWIGFYQASDLGRIKSLSRKIYRSHCVEPMILKERILASSISKNGYPSFHMSRKNKNFSGTVHSIVGKVFLGHNIKEDFFKVIDHKNNIKTDNRLSNLQVITRRENNCKDKVGGTSKLRGVSYDKSRNKWSANISLKGFKSFLIGRFEKEEVAGLSYIIALENIDLFSGCTNTFRKSIIKKLNEKS